MPKFHTVPPEVASAALAQSRPYRETRLALHLPMPEAYGDPRQAPEADPADDAVALVLDRDGGFTWTRSA